MIFEFCDHSMSLCQIICKIHVTAIYSKQFCWKKSQGLLGVYTTLVSVVPTQCHVVLCVSVHMYYLLPVVIY